MKKLSLLVGGLFLSPLLFSQVSYHAKAKALVARMTTEEKVALLVGNGMKIPGQSQNSPTIGTTKDKVPGAAGTTKAIPRLGIPSLVLADGPAGVRIDSTRDNDNKTYYATAWPVGTLLASSWDTALVQRVGKAFGHEVKEYGVDIILAPALNIQRNPLGGRNFEYYSEDPVVAGNIAAAIVNGIQSNGVGTSIKHFAANNQETNRNTVDEFISERALREIYLKGFEIAVKKSQPWTVMSSYNLINGTYASQSHGLLTDILRKEWGFKGFVMTDWFGGVDAVAQMKAGNDLLEPGTQAQTDAILAALKKGDLDIRVVNENAERILTILLQSPSYKKYAFSNKPDLAKDAAISREAATQGMVLLKNQENALPFEGVRNIALFGYTAYRPIAGGTGSGDVNKAYTISLQQGIDNAGYRADDALRNFYNQYIADQLSKRPKKSFFEEFLNPTPPIPEAAVDGSTIGKIVSSNDIAVITIGRNAGEGRDRSKEEGDFRLTQDESNLIKNVSTAFHAQNKKVVVVLNIGGIVETASWTSYADAVLLAWQPGLEAGNAIADILSGKVNPSGKLAVTFPVNYEDDPTAKEFPGKEFTEKATTGLFGKVVPAETTYSEGIYVGYRYYNTFNVKPAYEFGYGLSYTSFKYSDLKLSNNVLGKQITVSVKVTNTGQVAGKEVVQLYVSAPSGKLDKPESELKAFGKTQTLQPGASQVLTFTIRPADIASFDSESSAWIAEAGKYTVKIGASSTDSRQQASFKLASTLIVEKSHKAVNPSHTIDELKP
ncbi:MAG: glycoside hydrolase family 3 C-terminal domain-containing protein [Chitinophagaceae bacterium]